MNPFERFTRKPAEQLTPWSDAQRYRDNGYMPLAVERTQATQAPSHALPGTNECPAGGGWAWGMGEPTTLEHWVTSIQCGILPRIGGKLSLDECSRTWVPVVRVSGAGKHVAKDIAAMAPGALVRLDVENGEVLVAFKTGADITDPRHYDFRRNRVTCYATGAFLVSSPRYVWLNERSPANVRRDELAPLSWSGARDLVAAIDGTLSKAA